MRMVLALCIAMGAQDTGEEYYKFKMGTTWTYSNTQGEEKTTVHLKVTEEGKDRIVLESRHQIPGIAGV